MKNINKISFVFIFLLVIFLVGCSNGRKKFEDDYQMFKGQEHVFEKVNYKTVYEALTKEGSYVILFAYDPDLYECPYCMEAIPIINEAALQEGVDKILYLDIRTMRVERTSEYLSLIDYIDEQVDDLQTRNDNLELIVPDLYVVKDGKILGHHIATLTDDEDKFILGLDSEQREELILIYKNLFKNVKS
ncbi:MAG: hypothetical protein WC006_01895 [Bacilli bacterium]